MVVLPVPFKVAVVRRWVEVAEEPNFRNTEIRPFHHNIAIYLAIVSFDNILLLVVFRADPKAKGLSQ